ncbi:MAG: glycosyltransferase family 4 protein [Chloroflexi bacterium]|nr:glycosyltransferase family 4 protein [Chloroflexota bacterium]
MKIAFVVQRYGCEVNGGSETLCRWVAEHLAKYFEVHVVTTCALDYLTWENSFPPGLEVINDVVVHRFAVGKTRDVDDFTRFSEKVFIQPHSYLDELEWMERQGPYSPDLLGFIRASRQQFDAFIFFTYLYFPTFFGLQLVPEKSLLVPTAHNEPQIYLDIFRTTFHLPRFLVYNTEAECRFVQKRFGNAHIPSQVVGTGVDLQPGMEPDEFRRANNIAGPFVLYVGRVHQSKGCQQLFDDFISFKQENPIDLKLVLMGKENMPVPHHPDIVSLGFVSEGEKVAGLRASSLVIVPSYYESLSLTTLEAWLAEKPVLVNGRCEVLREHCQRSDGGLYYATYDEYKECLGLLCRDAALRQRLAINGREYVAANYTWPTIERKYRDILEEVISE